MQSNEQGGGLTVVVGAAVLRLFVVVPFSEKRCISAAHGHAAHGGMTVCHFCPI